MKKDINYDYLKNIDEREVLIKDFAKKDFKNEKKQ